MAVNNVIMKHDAYLYQDILSGNYMYVTSYLKHLFPANMMDFELKVWKKVKKVLNSIRTDKNLMESTKR